MGQRAWGGAWGGWAEEERSHLPEVINLIPRQILRHPVHCNSCAPLSGPRPCRALGVQREAEPARYKPVGWRGVSELGVCWHFSPVEAGGGWGSGAKFRRSGETRLVWLVHTLTAAPFAWRCTVCPLPQAGSRKSTASHSLHGPGLCAFCHRKE
jgi:hypothetical protein